MSKQENGPKKRGNEDQDNEVINFEKAGFNENDLFNNSNIDSLKRSKEFLGSAVLYDYDQFGEIWKGSTSSLKNPFSQESSVNNQSKVKNQIKSKNRDQRGEPKERDYAGMYKNKFKNPSQTINNDGIVENMPSLRPQKRPTDLIKQVEYHSNQQMADLKNNGAKKASYNQSAQKKIRQKKESKVDKGEPMDHDFDSFHVAFNMYKKQQTQQQRHLTNELHGKVIGSKKYVDLTKKNSEFTNSLTINDSVLLSEEDIETSELNSSRQKKKNETKSSRKDKIIAKKLDSKKNLNAMCINYIGEIDDNDNIIPKIERSAKKKKSSGPGTSTAQKEKESVEIIFPSFKKIEKSQVPKDDEHEQLSPFVNKKVTDNSINAQSILQHSVSTNVRDLEETAQLSNDDFIEVVGSGMLNEMFQQRGDEDSRRYRVFQHYLRNTKNGQKSRKPKKTPDMNEKKNKDQKNQADNDLGQLSWSSSSSDSNDNLTTVQASKITVLKTKILQHKQSLTKTKKEDVVIKSKKPQTSSAQEFEMRSKMSKNIFDQKELMKKVRKEQCSKTKGEMIQQLNTFQDQLANIENYADQELLEKQQRKLAKMNQIDQEFIIQGSDEDTFYDQTIQLIAQHSETTKDRFLFSPDSTGKAAWEVLGLIFIIYQSILIPFRICFNEVAKGFVLGIENTIDVSFMLDILVQFNCGFYAKGNLINGRKDIVINYVMGWFSIDLVASFPYGWVFSDGTDPETGEVQANAAMARTPQLLKLVKMARFLRFLRLLRVLKLKQILYRIEELIMNDALVATLNLLKVVAVVLFIGHWIACIFYAIGDYEFKNKYSCWLTNAGLENNSVEEKYIASLYWAFATMTTVGYGDIFPITILEKIFAMMSMIVACGVFAYVVGSIETIVRRSNTIESQFKEKILHVNQFLMHQNVPKNLIRQVRRYLEQMQEHKKKVKFDQQEVLSMLNKNLRDEVLIQIIGGMIRKKRIFTYMFDERLQSEIIFLLEQKLYLMDDLVFDEGEKQDSFYKNGELEEGQFIANTNKKENAVGQGLFFIIQGDIILLQKDTRTYIKDLSIGNIFGEIGFFSGQPRTITARSRGFSELMYLSQYDFLKTIHNKHTHTLNLYNKIRMLLFKNPSDYTPLYIKCFRCQARGHIATQCQFFYEIKGNLARKTVLDLQIKKEQELQIIKEDQKMIKQQLDDIQNESNKSHDFSEKEDENSFNLNADSEIDSQNSIGTQTEIESSDIQPDDNQDDPTPESGNINESGYINKLNSQRKNTSLYQHHDEDLTPMSNKKQQMNQVKIKLKDVNQSSQGLGLDRTPKTNNDITPKSNLHLREGGEHFSQISANMVMNDLKSKKHNSIGNETSMYESQNSQKNIDAKHMKNIITPDSENLKKYKEAAEDKKINYLTSQSNSQPKDTVISRQSETSKMVSSKIDDESSPFDQTPKNYFQSNQSSSSKFDKLNVPLPKINRHKSLIKHKTLIHREFQDKTLINESHIECNPREFKKNTKNKLSRKITIDISSFDHPAQQSNQAIDQLNALNRANTSIKNVTKHSRKNDDSDNLIKLDTYEDHCEGTEKSQI